LLDVLAATSGLTSDFPFLLENDTYDETAICQHRQMCRLYVVRIGLLAAAWGHHRAKLFKDTSGQIEKAGC